MLTVAPLKLMAPAPDTAEADWRLCVPPAKFRPASASTSKSPALVPPTPRLSVPESTLAVPLLLKVTLNAAVDPAPDLLKIAPGSLVNVSCAELLMNWAAPVTLNTPPDLLLTALG